MMEKFQNLPYSRPDGEALLAAVRALPAALKAAPDGIAAKAVYEDFLAQLEAAEEQFSLADIRSSLDTTDKFYEDEVAYAEALAPQLAVAMQDVSRVILDAPWRTAFEAYHGSQMLRSMEAQLKVASPETIEEQKQDALLRQQHSRVTGGAHVEFAGQDCNLAALQGKMHDADRAVRKAAFDAWAGLYEKIAPELEEIYDKMVAVRTRIGKKLGYENYVPVGFLNRGHYDYTPADVANFREEARDVLIPAAQTLYDRQAKALGIDKIRYYDEGVSDPAGSPKPLGGTPGMVRVTSEMFHELSWESGEFIDFMERYNLFDLDTRIGKRMGGYTTTLHTKQAPFIFANSTGEAGDVSTFVHECGHALQAYLSMRQGLHMEQCFASADLCEIHSEGMELLAYPWAERYFGAENGPRYRAAHLAESVTFLPYRLAVDEFQTRVYENPDCGILGRRQIWHELEQKYLPWRDYDGNAFLESGGFWMQKLHIFQNPFYYIEYALAQMGAYEFYGKFKLDPKRTWQNYLSFCMIGGRLGYYESLKKAGLRSPFAPGSVRAIMQPVYEELGL